MTFTFLVYGRILKIFIGTKWVIVDNFSFQFWLPISDPIIFLLMYKIRNFLTWYWMDSKKQSFYFLCWGMLIPKLILINQNYFYIFSYNLFICLLSTLERSGFPTYPATRSHALPCGEPIFQGADHQLRS